MRFFPLLNRLWLTLRSKDGGAFFVEQVVCRTVLSMENNTNNDRQAVIKQEIYGQPEDNCSMTNAWKIIGGKWKLLILNAIRQQCPARFGELKKKLQDITQTTLTAQLRELERDGILSRKVYAESPPKVEYQLTELGKTLVPVMKVLSDWGDNYCQVTKG